MTPPAHAHSDLHASQQRWRDERRYLNEHRHDLAQLARQLYSDIPQVQGLLTSDGWIPPAPIPLDEVHLGWDTDPPSPRITGAEPPSATVRPLASSAGTFPTYSAAMAQLAPPTTFENRPCYGLTGITTTAAAPQLTFSTATYFDVIDVAEAVAHELAQAAQDTGQRLPSEGRLPFRRSIGDPRDLAARTVVPAASVLTIRRSSTDGPTMLLHRRDSTKVAHGGGLYQVVPVGVFQPTSPTQANWTNDFDLWRFITREYDEELLGAPENTSNEPLDYDAWPFYQALQKAIQNGSLQVFWLGLGMDPLSLVTDILVAAVFDQPVFDELFQHLVETNAEGDIVGVATSSAGTVGIPFTQAAVDHFTGTQPMQAAGAALLDLAWRHRATLVGSVMPTV